MTHKMFAQLARTAVLAIGVASVVACNDDDSPIGPESGDAHVRVVNSLYQIASDGDTVAQTIDHVFDSLEASPSIMALSPNSISVSSDEPAGYRTLAPGVHSFVARIAGGSPPNPSVYVGQNGSPYLPRVYLNAGRYYTIIVAGTIPASGSIPYGTSPFILLGEDLLPGRDINGTTQARFKVLHAAPYTGSSVTVYVVPGGLPLARPLAEYASQGSASYRSMSSYLNVNPGTYTVTLTDADDTVVAQQAIVFDEGDVKTLVLQNTSSQGSGTANHKLTVLNDYHYEN